MIIGKTLALDDVGNLKFDKDGNFIMLERDDSFLQTCEIHLLTVQGEDNDAPWMGNPLMRLMTMSRDVKSDEFLEMSSRIALNPQNVVELERVENIEINKEDRRASVYIRVVDKNSKVHDFLARFRV